MRLSDWSPALRYGLAALAYGLILGTTTALQRLWGIRFDATPLIILTMIASAWYGGKGPGLLVAILFEATLDYYGGFPRDPLRFALISFNRIVLFASVVLFASARRNAETRLRQQGQRLEEAVGRERAARADAEAANRLKDDFLATVSHELRTPLNAILGWTKILGRETIDENTKRQAISVIERNARAQAHIVEDLLDFSGVARGLLRIDPRPVPLASIVKDAIHAVRPSATTKSIRIEASLDESAVVRGDSERLRQIAWNLLTNAVKFTPQDGFIDIRVERIENDVRMRVEDSGIGIDAAFLPHVFEPFRQADSSATRLHSGLGLGLSLVRHLVELHGGTIAAESPGTGRGSVFTLKLPDASDMLTTDTQGVATADTDRTAAV